MKTPDQSLKEEVGLYLRLKREADGKSLTYIAQKLGYSNTFLSKVEKGLAPVPLDRVLDFSLAYEIPVPDFVRIVLVTMHNDAYRALMSILLSDPEMAKAAHQCHTISDMKELQKRRQELNPGLSSKSLDRMRSFIKKNKKPSYGKPVVE